MTYVALLRGINVGGNKKVEMKKLKATFEALGFTNVASYINSGNIVFSDTEKDQEKIAQKIEHAIIKDFKLEVNVLVRDLKNLRKICATIPESWQNNPDMRTEVLFLWKDAATPKILAQIPTNPKVDRMKYVAGAAIWNIHRKDYKQSAFPKIIGTKLYRQMTGRNINTVRKLEKMLSSIQ